MKKLTAIILILSFISFGLVGQAYAAESKAGISAESRVRGLAIKAENSRKMNGMVISGCGLAIASLSFLSSATTTGLLLKNYYLYYGLAFAGIGAATYFIPSGIENDFLNIEVVSKDKINERELLAAKSLKDRSEEAERGRTWGSVLLGGFGALFYNTSPAVGFLYLGLAGYSYLTKSEVEREHDEYVAERE